MPSINVANLSIKFTEEQYKDLRKKAYSQNISMANYVRLMLGSGK